jgi:S-adenosylmethionine synthetase
MVGAYGTGVVPSSELTEIVLKEFDLRPAAIIERLDLRRPIFRKTTNYGHFGRELPEFSWEKTDMAETLKKAIK